MHDEPTDVLHGYCQCGCGQQTRVSHKTVRAKGWVKGEPLRYRNGHNAARLGDRVALRYLERECGYTSPCWVWQLHISKQGYGRSMMRHGSNLAHRHYYEQHVGPIPNGLELDHLCRNRACVNPAHLEPVTLAEKRASGRQREADCRSGAHDLSTCSRRRNPNVPGFGIRDLPVARFVNQTPQGMDGRAPPGGMTVVPDACTMGGTPAERAKAYASARKAEDEHEAAVKVAAAQLKARKATSTP